MNKFLETSNYIHFSPKCYKCFHLGLASKHLELRPRRKKNMLPVWCETERKILSDDLMKSWWMSSKYLEAIHMRFESKAWPVDFPSLSSRGSLPAGVCGHWQPHWLKPTHTYLLSIIFDDFKTFVIGTKLSRKKKNDSWQLCFLPSDLISYEASGPCHGKGGALCH